MVGTMLEEFRLHVKNHWDMLKSKEERYPITIQKYDDPDWSYFDSVCR